MVDVALKLCYPIEQLARMVPSILAQFFVPSLPISASTERDDSGSVLLIAAMV
jgi:hypothetical protein